MLFQFIIFFSISALNNPLHSFCCMVFEEKSDIVLILISLLVDYLCPSAFFFLIFFFHLCSLFISYSCLVFWSLNKFLSKVLQSLLGLLSIISYNFCDGKSSVQFSRSVASNSLQPHELQHTKPPCPLPTPRVHPNPCPSSRWCHPAISFSVIPFSSCPQSLPASETFPVSQFFAWSGQSTGVSTSASVLPVNIQDRSPLEWIGWISLQSKGLSRAFSNTTGSKASILQHSAFFTVQLSHPYMINGKIIALTRWTFVEKVMSLLLNMLSRLVITFLPRSKRLNFMAAFTICSNLGAPKNKVWHRFHCFPIYLPWSDGTRSHDLRFLNVEL